MKSRASHQNRFLRIVTIPIRALGRARDFYVKSMTNYADRVSYGNMMGLPSSTGAARLPKSFSVNSSRSYEENEDYKELLRAASVRSMGSSFDINMLIQQQQQKQMIRQPQQASKGVPRSCSVGMGRIDEDQPCVFGDDNITSMKKTELMYPRSRTYAVRKRSMAF